MKNKSIKKLPLTRIIYSRDMVAPYLVENYSSEGELQAAVKVNSHSEACVLAFGTWNNGNVVDLTAK